MPISLDTAVVDKLDEGNFILVDLVKFTLDGSDYGYSMMGRDFVYDSVTYKANKYLDTGSFNETLGQDINSRTLTFSNVPTGDVSDAIENLESLAYRNAPVVVTTVIGDPDTDSIVGLLASYTYLINNVEYQQSGFDEDGNETLTIAIELEPPSRTGRESQNIKRTVEDQQFDNDSSCTGFEYAGIIQNFTEEWGRTK